MINMSGSRIRVLALLGVTLFAAAGMAHAQVSRGATVVGGSYAAYSVNRDSTLHVYELNQPVGYLVCKRALEWCSEHGMAQEVPSQGSVFRGKLNKPAHTVVHTILASVYT